MLSREVTGCLGMNRKGIPLKEARDGFWGGEAKQAILVGSLVQAFTYLKEDYGSQGRRFGSACFGFQGNVETLGSNPKMHWMLSAEILG